MFIIVIVQATNNNRDQNKNVTKNALTLNTIDFYWQVANSQCASHVTDHIFLKE